MPQIARLKAGATVQQAQSQLDAINAANFERFPAWQEILKNARFGSEVVDFQSNLIGERQSTLTMLWGGAIFVLLIGCVNVANLVLVRSTSRIRELATRHAMGATFGRLSRQALPNRWCCDRRRARRTRLGGGRCRRAVLRLRSAALRRGAVTRRASGGFRLLIIWSGRARHDSRGRHAPRKHGTGDS